MKSFSVHIDIYVVPPTKERRYGLLITSGMSELPMNPPPDVWKWWKIDVNKLPKEARKALNCDFAELVIKLPPDWPLPYEELKKDDDLKVKSDSEWIGIEDLRTGIKLTVSKNFEGNVIFGIGALPCLLVVGYIKKLAK